MITFKESCEMSEFMNVETPKIVADIVTRYRTDSQMKIEAALAHAAWVGYCRGREFK